MRVARKQNTAQYAINASQNSIIIANGSTIVSVVETIESSLFA